MGGRPSTLDVALLGRVEVRSGGDLLELGRNKRRCVLASLALARGGHVSIDRLMDELWGGDVPATARTIIHGHISALRRLLPPDRLKSSDGGYVLELGPGELDLDRFDHHLDAGIHAQSEGDHATALRELEAAESLWRGPILGGLEVHASTAELARAEDRRVLCRAHRIDAALALGRHLELIAELEVLVKEEPWNEQLRAQLVLAMYRSGRQADALETIRALRETLADELGIDPSHEIQRLELAVLNHAPDLDLRPLERPGGPNPSSAASVRRIDRRLASFLVGRPDDTGRSAQQLPSRDSARSIIEDLGGTIYETADDRIVAMFGIDRPQEDSSARACAAAVELARHAARIGIASGHVLVGDEGLVTSIGATRPVRLAAALAKSATPSDILLDATTKRLARSTIDVDVVRGRTRHPALQTQTIFRLSRMRPDPLVPPVGGAIVGRDAELALLHGAFDRTVHDGSCHLFSLAGPAGIGKSRLASEFVRDIGNRATVLAGRCLPYGSDITYWPVNEVIRQAVGIADSDDPDTAASKIAGFLVGEPDAGSITETILALIGRSHRILAPEEPSWAIRRFLERAARDRPVILVFDDIHWAEQTFLDLVQSLAGSVRGTLLLLCLARPDLLEDHPSWGGGRVNSTTTLLQHLTESESQELIHHALGRGRLDEALANRIGRAAEGNPLFVLETVSMLLDEGRLKREPGGWVLAEDGDGLSLPPTIEAIVQARLDRLEEDERIVLERAAIIGLEFSVGEVMELAPEPEREGVPRILDSLKSRELVLSEAGAPDALRFRHILVRDTAYAGIPEGVRARLHVAFADRLERTMADRIEELEEIVGYHLECAVRDYEAAAGRDEERAAAAARAGPRLASAGHRAFDRDDPRGAASLLRRAVRLLAPDDPERPRALRELGEALLELGSWPESGAILKEARESADGAGVLRESWLARLLEAELRAYSTDDVPGSELVAFADEAIEAMRAAGDAEAEARAWRFKGDMLTGLAQQGAATEAFERGAEAAGAAGVVRELRARGALGLSLGPLPAEEAVVRLEAIIEELEPRPLKARAHLAYLLAMLGRSDDARRQLATCRAQMEDFGSEVELASFSMYEGAALMLMGDVEAAERTLAAGIVSLQRMGDRYMWPTSAAMQAQAAYASGRREEAGRLAELSEHAATADDLVTQTIWRGVRAKILADAGELRAAEELAREGTEIGDSTDFLNVRGEAHLDLAAVLARAGKTTEARREIEDAIALFSAKDNVVRAEQGSRLLSELPEGSAT